MQTMINKTMNIQLFPYPKKITAINKMPAATNMTGRRTPRTIAKLLLSVSIENVNVAVM